MTPQARPSRREGKPPHRLRRWPGPAFVLAALAATGYLHLHYAGVPDADAFWHLRHASLYAQRGLFDSSFPWAAYSVMSRLPGDVWYGFHLLLIPFSYLPGPFLQIKVAGACLLASLLILTWWSLRRLGVAYPWLWPFVLLLIAPGQLWRLQMTRPHLISLGLGLLLLSFSIKGKWWQVGLISLTLTFFHLNFFWLTPMVVGMGMVVRTAVEKRLEWRALLAAILGWVAGWLLRPDPMATLQLLNVQIVQLMSAKRQGIPLEFGSELFPMDPAHALAYYRTLLPLWVAAVGVFIVALLRRRIGGAAEVRALLWSSLALSLLCFNLMCLVSRRAADLWILFAIVLIAAVLTMLQAGANTRATPPVRWARGGVLLLGALLLAHASLFSIREEARQMALTPPAERGKAMGLWLREHARPGEIVCNVHWADAPELFYWSPQSRFVGGMDPIFQYVHDPARYWKIHHLALGDVLPDTCGAVACTPENREDLHTVLRRDFQAAHVLLNQAEDQELLSLLRRDRRFRIGFEDAAFAIAEVRPTPR